MAAAEWAVDAKRQVIIAAEAKIDHFTKLMQEKPRLAALYNYWRHWYIARRADWYTRLWLELVKNYKANLRKWEKEATINSHLQDAELIRKNVEAIEDGMESLKPELIETLKLAKERKWKIRYPRSEKTMENWLNTIKQRYREIRHWIKLIKRELPQPWIDFVYVIYYAYTSPGAERHLEAHFEGQCQRNEKIQQTVREYANKLLRAWVAADRIEPDGTVKPGYSVPLLQKEMSKSPYQGKKTSGQNLWQWGIQWEAAINYNVADKRVVESESTLELRAKRTITIRCELFDYDYSQLRKYEEFLVPAAWWELSLEALFKLFGLEEKR